MEVLSHLLEGDNIDGQAAAVGDGSRALVYEELIDRVGRLAAALIGAGVQPGDRVGIHLRKSVESMVAVHASLRAGGIHVPLDAAAPVGYVADLIRDGDVRVIVTDASPGVLSELAAATSLETTVGPDEPLDGLRGVSWADVADHGHESAVPRSPDDPAYIIYTSGSTGRPKGIVHTHRGGLRYAELAATTYGLRADDRLANIAPLHFDQSTFELFAAPLAGSSVLLVPDPVLRFPASVSDLLERERTTVWYSVPYLLIQLLKRGALDQRDLSSLRWVLFGGEIFPPGLLRELMTGWPNARFSNVYGPAETNQCTHFHLDAPPLEHEPVPIGRPWAGAEVLVAGDDGRPVEVGQAGELLVRAETAMAGYWAQPEATAAALRPGLGAEQPWYATGDLVRQREDGNLVFLGRSDHQIKVRGHRVELEAVETALADVDGIAEAAAVLRDDELVALVVTKGDLAHEGALARLRHQLPAYAVPVEIIEVGGLPRTATAKIDRRRARELLDDP